MPLIPTPLGCYGSKKQELKRILEYMAGIEYGTFVEPFCGSAIVSKTIYTMQPSCPPGGQQGPTLIHINDIDVERMDFYSCCRDDAWREQWQKYELEVLGKGRDEYYKIMREDNFFSYVISKRIYGVRHGSYPRDSKTKIKEVAAPSWVEFFNNAKMSCGDWLEVVNMYKDDPDALIFLDPPYLDSENSTYNKYATKSDDKTILDNTQIYIDILKLLQTAKCKVFMIVNSNALMKHLYEGYVKQEYSKTYQNTKKRATHLIVANFGP